MTSFNLEKSAKELTEAIAKAPPLNGVSLEDARKAVEAAQSAPIPMPDVDESWVTVSSAFGGSDRRRRPLPFLCLGSPRRASDGKAVCEALRLAMRTLGFLARY
jgi:hypothetical protein